MSRFGARLRGEQRHGTGSTEGSRPAVTEALVRCEGCGVHVPRSRTLSDGADRRFCSVPCRDKARERSREESP